MERKSKRAFRDRMLDPHPQVTVMIDPSKTGTAAILCVGTSRENMAQRAGENGWVSFEMVDFEVVL